MTNIARTPGQATRRQKAGRAVPSAPREQVGVKFPDALARAVQTLAVLDIFDEILRQRTLPEDAVASGAPLRLGRLGIGHYHEPSGIQFGLLRRDYTPSPADVALAAVGRFLAGARLLGRWCPGNHRQIYAFPPRPDGIERDVLVAWAKREVDWPARGRTRPLGRSRKR